jgi:hypothetical protein
LLVYLKPSHQQHRLKVVHAKRKVRISLFTDGNRSFFPPELRCHDAITVQGRIIRNLPAVVLYPVTSPVSSVGPSDFHLFELLKKHLAGKRTAADAYVMQAVTSWLQTLETYVFYAGNQALVAGGTNV